MAITHLVNDASAYTVSPCAVAYPSSNTLGSLLVASIMIESGTAGVQGITDTRLNSWALAKQQHNATAGVTNEIWYAPNCAAGANTVTVTLNTGAIFTCPMIGEYSGVATSLPLDVTAGANQVNSANFSSGAASTLAGDLIIGFAAQSNLGFATAGSGFTRRLTFVNNVYQQNEDGVFSAAGSNAATFTGGGSVSTITTVMAAFKAPSSGSIGGLGLMGCGRL